MTPMTPAEIEAELRKNDTLPSDPLERCQAILAIIVFALHKQGAHSGFERPESEPVDVRLPAGLIRHAVAAVNATSGGWPDLPKPVPVS